MTRPKKITAVLGASPNPERYSNRAIKMLLERGHAVVPVNPGHVEIEGLPVARNLTAIAQPIDTITLYVSPERLPGHLDELLRLHPRRVIFNPGTEAPDIEGRLRQAGIEVMEACTLVLLRTGQY